MKEKRRSNEKRKEKSRDAARCRRSRETDIFTDLAGALPVVPAEAAHLDKASVMRLAIAYLRTRSVMDAIPESIAKPENPSEMDGLFLKALDGFVMVLSSNGDMVYLSPNVKNYLGIAQLDLMGQSVFEYSHPCDHDEIRECFSSKPNNPEVDDQEHSCNFFLRLKCTITSKGRKVNLKSASYKVIQCTGKLVVSNNEEKKKTSEDGTESLEESNSSLILVASPVPHPSNIEVPLGKYTFLSKHSMNMKFTYADDKLADFLGWDSDELLGQSVFDFYHALDNVTLDKSFKSLYSKGQCETMAYRFLSKTGGYAWVITQAALIHCTRQHKPLSVVCVNYLLSGIEHEDEIYSHRQVPAAAKPIATTPTRLPARVPPAGPPPQAASPTAPLPKLLQPRQPEVVIDLEPNNNNNNDDNDSHKPEIPRKPPVEEKPVAVTASLFRYQKPKEPTPGPGVLEKPEAGRVAPQTATESIFAPRTKDMNKGFLTFSEDQPGLTMLKDEPDDLTHLAPTAGDVCVPLEDPPFLTDMLDEFILNSSYCPLLSPDDDLPPSPPAPTDKDATFVYRDSPKSSGDSLDSPTDSGRGLSEDEMLMLNIGDVIAEDEFAMRAPYIPMSDQDEALQMLISDDMVMWGPSQPGAPAISPEKKAARQLLHLEEEGPMIRLGHEGKGDGQQLVSPAQIFGQINVKAEYGNTLKERASKRSHGRPPGTAGSKRIRTSDLGSPVLTQHHQSQLLQQLMGSSSNSSPGKQQRQVAWQSPPPLENLGNSFGEEEGDGAGAPGGDDVPRNTQQQQQQQQSNSVLMNLLVSGCDTGTPGSNLQMDCNSSLFAAQLERLLSEGRAKLASQLISAKDLQTVPEWTSPKKQLPPQSYGPNFGMDFLDDSMLEESDLLAGLVDPRALGAFDARNRLVNDGVS